MYKKITTYFLLSLCLLLSSAKSEAKEIIFDNITSNQDSPDKMPGDSKCESNLQGNPCTLRAAVEEANSYPGLDPAKDQITIEVPPGNYYLDSVLVLSSLVPITLRGMEAKSTMLYLVNSSNILDIKENVNINIESLTLSGARGGAILNHKNATLKIKNSIFYNNSAEGYIYKGQNDLILEGSKGGAVYNEGFLEVENTHFEMNTAEVPDISNNLTDQEKMSAKVISGSLGASGGAIANIEGAKATIKRSSFNNNWGQHGAAIYSYKSEVKVENSTLFENGLIAYSLDDMSPSSVFGGVVEFADLLDQGLIASSTFYETDGDYTIFGFDADIYIKNSIMRGDCAAVLKSGNYNLIYLKNPDCTFQQQPDDRVGTANAVIDPLFAPLHSYGITQGYPLLAGSPAIDGGDPEGCKDFDNNPITLDQSGYTRQGACDIGAVEVICGNKIIDPGEACDDGNLVDDDSCNNACQVPGTSSAGGTTSGNDSGGSGTAGDGSSSGGCSLHPEEGAAASSLGILALAGILLLSSFYLGLRKDSLKNKQ